MLIKFVFKVVGLRPEEKYLSYIVGIWFMKREWFVLLVLLLSAFSFVSAYSANVTFIDDIGTFSGAVMRVEAPVSGSTGDKIFPSENMANVGILKFEVETSLAEVLLNFVVTKSGMIVGEYQEGPFSVNGSEIVIDKRVKSNPVELISEVAEEEEVVENASNESEVASEVEESEEEAEEETESQASESEVLSGLADSIIGTSLSFEEEYYMIKVKKRNLFLFLVGGVLTFIVLMISWFRFGRFRDFLTRLNYFSEEGELARIEASIRRKISLMAKIRKNKELRKKIKSSKKKLSSEEHKLEGMVKRNMKEEARENAQN